MRNFNHIIAGIFIVVLVAALSENSVAQTLSTDQYVRVFTQVDSMMTAYANYSTLLKDGEDRISEGAIEKFKSLFEPTAKIDDDLVLAFYDGNIIDHHQYKERTVEEYCRKVQATYSDGVSLQILNANVYYGELAMSKSSRIMVEKLSKATSNGGLIVEVRDTVELTIVFNEGYVRPKIRQVKVKTAGNKVIPGFKHINDVDRDFIPDDKDPCRTKPGFANADSPGCPSVNERVESPEPNMVFDGGVVVGGLGTSILTGERSLAAYELSENHSATNKTLAPELSSSVLGINLGFSYYFGRSAHFGVGTGLQYLMYSGNVSSTPFKVSYKETDAAGNEYRRVISSRADLNEKYNASQINIPLLLKWKGDVNLKIKYEIGLGMIYGLNVTGKTKYEDNRLNYEGVHTALLDPDGSLRGWIYSSEDTDAQVLYEEGTIDGYNPGHSELSLETAAENGNDFGLNEAPQSSMTVNEFTYSSGVNLAVAPTLFYKIDNNLSVSLGGLITMGNWTNEKDVADYYISKKVGEYNTMMNSISESDNLMYALTLGVRWSIIKE